MAELKLLNSLIDNRYQIVERKSIGSYSEIFIARDQQQDDKPVIIKSLNLQLQGTLDAELEQLLIKNFRNESEALSQLSHPNIINKIDEGAITDQNGVLFYYIVLEYLSGGDLLQRCKQHPLSLSEIVKYLRQICDALDYAHSQNVIHRDIKPNNLLLAADTNIVKIADFGIARVNRGITDDVTRVGSNCYAPPEHHPSSQIEKIADNQLTPAADIYSLAKTVYALLTGHAPYQFEGKPITELPAEFSTEPWASGLLGALSRATNTEVAARYQTAGEFYQAIDSVWQDSQEITRVRPTRAAALTTAATASANNSANNVADARIVVPLTDSSSGVITAKDHSKKYLALLSIAMILAFSLLAYSYYRPQSKINSDENNVEINAVETNESLPVNKPVDNSDRKLIRTNQNIGDKTIDLTPTATVNTKPDSVEPGEPTRNITNKIEKENSTDSKWRSEPATEPANKDDNETNSPTNLIVPAEKVEPNRENPQEGSREIAPPETPKATPQPESLPSNPASKSGEGESSKPNLPPTAAPNTEPDSSPETPKKPADKPVDEPEKENDQGEIDLRKEAPPDKPDAATNQSQDDEIDLRNTSPKETSQDDADIDIE